MPGDGDPSVFDRFGQSLASTVNFSQYRREFLHSYIEASVEMPALWLSAIGEAEQYPLANRQAIAQKIAEILCSTLYGITGVDI